MAAAVQGSSSTFVQSAKVIWENSNDKSLYFIVKEQIRLAGSFHSLTVKSLRRSVKNIGQVRSESHRVIRLWNKSLNRLGKRELAYTTSNLGLFEEEKEIEDYIFGELPTQSISGAVAMLKDKSCVTFGTIDQFKELVLKLNAIWKKMDEIVTKKMSDDCVVDWNLEEAREDQKASKYWSCLAVQG